MPMTAISGRGRLRGFSAASVVSASSEAIAGAAETAAAGGSVKSQPPKPATPTTIIPAPTVTMRRAFMAVQYRRRCYAWRASARTIDNTPTLQQLRVYGHTTFGGTTYV